MSRVVVRILHRPAGPVAPPLECMLAEARASLAAGHVAAFRAAGTADARIAVLGEADPFGDVLRRAIADTVRGRQDADRPGKVGDGLVVLGSGSIPLATAADLRRLLEAAASTAGPVLVNNRYSADVVAIPAASTLPPIPDLPGDNALPRWLEENAGRTVTDLVSTWRLQVDIDSPLDLLLLAGRRLPFELPPATVSLDGSPVAARLAAVRAVLADRRGECTLFGRVSTRTLAWFERATASRTRVLVEERGLRASSRVAQAADHSILRRPPRSILGMALDREGPEALGAVLAELGEAALVDTRVLLAHRLGADEAGWPTAEDRFASDLLLPARVEDPWLRALTQSALDAPIPILLGGHSLVGPGLRLVASTARTRR